MISTTPLVQATPMCTRSLAMRSTDHQHATSCHLNLHLQAGCQPPHHSPSRPSFRLEAVREDAWRRKTKLAWMGVPRCRIQESALSRLRGHGATSRRREGCRSLPQARTGPKSRECRSALGLRVLNPTLREVRGSYTACLSAGCCVLSLPETAILRFPPAHRHESPSATLGPRTARP